MEKLNLNSSLESTIFLEEAMAHSYPKFLSLSACTLWVIIIISLLFGIIWYERFGRDQARTLINQQVASICWSGILWLLLVEVPFIVRFMTNTPFNVYFCMAQMTINQILTISSLLLFDSVAITRYVLIFWLKNPGAINDDIWSCFINIWIYFFAVISQAVFLTSQGHWSINYYVCTGISPFQDFKNQPSKFLGVQTSVVIFSLVCHLAISLRIRIYKRKLSSTSVAPSDAPVRSELMNNKNRSQLIDMTILGLFIMAMPFTYSYTKANQMSTMPDDIEKFPVYLVIYLYHFILPLTALFSFVVIFYCRNPFVMTYLIRELKERFKDCSEDAIQAHLP